MQPTSIVMYAHVMVRVTVILHEHINHNHMHHHLDLFNVNQCSSEWILKYMSMFMGRCTRVFVRVCVCDVNVCECEHVHLKYVPFLRV